MTTQMNQRKTDVPLYYLFLIIDFCGHPTENSSSFLVLNIIHFLPVFTLKQSVKEVFMLLLFLGIGVLVFSTLVFYADYHHPVRISCLQLTFSICYLKPFSLKKQ